MSKPRARNRPNSSRRKSSNPPPRATGSWLWGVHAVAAALANPARHLTRLVGTKNGLARLPSAPSRAELLAPGEIDALLPRDAVHQGLAAQFDPLPALALEDVIGRGTDRIAVLDQVSDPHNLGAIYRSAAAFGFGAIVLQTRHAPPITGIVAKAAVGAVERVSECRVVNIARTLETLAVAGYHTIGLAADGDQSIDRAVRGAGKLAIVLGAEGSGLRPAVAKACAERASIPITAAIESLNVSNAAAIAFYEASRARSAS
ncbi:MAG: RNA methyltransferase [Pseudomonadota bacterium]